MRKRGTSKNVGHASIIGNVGDKGTTNIGPSAKSRKKDGAGQGDEPSRVLVMVAKGKERECVESVFSDAWEEQEHEVDGTRIFYHENGIQVTVADLDNMGKAAVEAKLPDLLRKIKPRFFTTVGTCAALERSVDKVFMFEKARGVNEDKELSCTVLDGAVDTWREDEAIFVERPDKDNTHTVLSIPDPNPAQPQANVEVGEAGGNRGDRLLGSKFAEAGLNPNVAGLEMEIYWMWRTIIDRNRQATQGRQIGILRALKGVSDNADEVLRAQHSVPACLNAARACIFYLLQLKKRNWI